MMKKLVATGFAVFLVSALFMTPLGVIQPVLEKQLAGLKLTGVSGTLLNGSVQSVTKNGTHYGKVNWEILPLASLTTLALKSTFQIDGNLLKAKGTAGIRPNKTLILTKTEFSIDARLLNTLQRQAVLGGEISGFINQATLRNGELPLIEGSLDWKQGTVSSRLLNLQAGNYQFKIQPETNGLLITPTANQAPMDITGNLKLGSDWLLQPDLRIKTKDPKLNGMLAFTGNPQADGTVHINNPLDLTSFF